MKIVYIASEPALSVNTVAIASGFRHLFADAENILVDPRRLLWPEYKAPYLTDKFGQCGFAAELLDPLEFKEVLHCEFPFRPYLSFMKLFQRLEPSVVVVMHEYGYAYYAVQAAKLFGIPSYHVQHAIYEPGRFELASASDDTDKTGFLSRIKLCGIKGMRRVYRGVRSLAGQGCPLELTPYQGRLAEPSGERYPVHADRIGVWSQHYKRLLMQLRPDFAASRIDVIGFPHGDSFINGTGKPGAQILAELGMKRAGRLALYLYCPFHEIIENVVRVHPEQAFLNAIRALQRIDPELNIVILPHPNYNFVRQVARLKILTADFSMVTVLETSPDFLEICRTADVVVGVASSLFYMAMLLQVPVVIQAYVLEKLDDYQAIEGGGAIPVFSEIILQSQLERALNDGDFLRCLRENQMCLAEKLLGACDGKSGQRTAGRIYDLIMTNQSVSV